MSQRIYISLQDAAPTVDNAVWEWLPATILDAIYFLFSVCGAPVAGTEFEWGSCQAPPVHESD
jgi:hypothetical protein